MSERRSDASDNSDSSPDKRGNDEETVVGGKPGDTGQGEETVVRKPAARNENATILSEPGSGQGSDDATVLRQPKSEPAPPSDDATVMRDRQDGGGEAAAGQTDDEDRTIMNPALDDDSTVLGDRAAGEADTTYVASQGPDRRSRGNTEAGRLLKNRFVLEEKVGSGGMGDVYKALDLRAQEAQERNPYIAIKILNENFARHRDAFISLQREASKTRGIPHNNIMGVYDFDREGDTVFMSMELLDGEPLDDYLKKHPEGVSRDDAWNIIDGVCQGLMRAHAAGIVHSDFKPGNIYWTGDKTAKVFDFGIARAVSNPGDIAADGEKTVFDAGELGALTPTYASYEMLKGKEPSTSDDVYALALVAYEVFTGRHPYNRTPADKALEQGLKPEPIPWMKRRHWRALKRGLAIKGEDRTATVEDFYAGLFSEDPPIFRYSVLGLVLIASISFGVYSYFNQATIPERLNELRGSASNSRDALVNRLDNREEWNFASPEWRQIIDESLNKVKLANIEMQEEFDQEPLPYVQELETKVLDAYLTKIKELRDLANARSQGVQEGLSLSQQEERLQEVLSLLEEAGTYMEIVKDRYNYDPAKVAAQESPLATALQLRQIELDDILEQQRLEEERRLAAEEAARQERLRQQQIQERNETYNAGLAELRDIFSCKGNIPQDELIRLGEVLQTLQNTDAERFQQDKPGIITAMAGCIGRRIGVKDPARAREVKAVAVDYFPDSEKISSIEIQDKDPCAARGLEGRGSGNRAWCTDKLSEGGESPQLVVIPPAQDQSIGKFAISRTEVKIGDYNQYCEKAGCQTFSGSSSLPVTNLSVEQARSYTEWLSDQSGREYRLPTVDEWLHAAKTTTGEELDENINCTVDSRGVRLGDRLRSALSGEPNPWGLYNHVGNARELAVADDELMAMGGAHTDPRSECTLDKRVAHSGEADSVTGFRVLREIHSP